MSWTNGQPFVATADHVPGVWGCYKDGRAFFCGLCGHYFEVGDTARFVVSKVAGNRFVCSSCDGPDVLQRFIAARAEVAALRERYRWAFRGEEYPPKPKRAPPAPVTPAVKEESDG